jgi:uncharacterized membrane protein YiaA
VASEPGQTSAETTVSAPQQEAADETGDETGDAGISMTTVLVMLVVLGVLVVGIFWALPAWFGGSVITVTPR